jgi:hypothetical protein
LGNIDTQLRNRNQSISLWQLADRLFEGADNYRGFNISNIQKKLLKEVLKLKDRGYLRVERSSWQAWNPGLLFKLNPFFWLEERTVEDIASADRKGSQIARLRIGVTEKGQEALSLYWKGWSR